MPLHFQTGEYAMRLESARQSLQTRGLDGILMFALESHYSICGYDTFGFALFQCLVLCSSGELHLLTRVPDFRQAQQTSTLPDAKIHIWKDVEGVNPAEHLAALLTDLGLLGKNLGIETITAGLTAFNGDLVKAALVPETTLTEASDLISLLRRIKSSAEIECTRKAAELSDVALDAAICKTRGGAFEGDILAAMQGAVFAGGGDYAGNEFILGSGEAALLYRYQSGRRHLDETDQLTLEWSGAWHRYHAAMMRTLVIGPANDAQIRMHAAAFEALVACENAIKPGAPMGDVFDAYARVFDNHGLSHARLNVCGYGMEAVYNPIWVDFPMFYEGNQLPMEPGNVFFMHMILMNTVSGLAMCWGHSVLLKEDGVERLSQRPLELVIC